MRNWRTNLGKHALIRLEERTKINEETLCSILDNKETVSLGFERKEYNRQSLLFFSLEDKKFFVAIQDQQNGFVITILTVEYWHNLSEKFFTKKLVITKSQLIKAILISDPENEVRYHPPIFTASSILLTCKKNQKNYKIGKFDMDLFFDHNFDQIKIDLKSKILEQINNKNIKEKEIDTISWGVGSHELKVNYINVSEFIDFTYLINEIKKDLDIRISLSKKYDGFLLVLNRINSFHNSENAYII